MGFRMSIWQKLFPVMVEAIFIHFLYEVMREAGLRMPKAVGHANTSTTLNIYAYFFHQSSKEAASIMADALLDEPAVVNHR